MSYAKDYHKLSRNGLVSTVYYRDDLTQRGDVGFGNGTGLGGGVHATYQRFGPDLSRYFYS